MLIRLDEVYQTIHLVVYVGLVLSTWSTSYSLALVIRAYGASWQVRAWKWIQCLSATTDHGKYYIIIERWCLGPKFVNNTMAPNVLK